MSRGKIALALIVAVVVGLLVWRVLAQRPGAARGRDADQGPIPVTAVAAAKRDVPVYLTSLGTVQALNTVTVRPQIGGRIESITFKEGEEVKKGDPIAQIDARSLQAQLNGAVAKQKQDEALLVAARSTLARYEDLIQKHFVATQDLENQRQTVRQQEALIAADAAAVDNARVQLGYTHIVAPFDAKAGIRLVDVGNLVQANDSTGIVVLTQVHPINVMFTLPEQNLDLVRKGGDDLPVTALNRADSSAIGSGKLTVIDNQIDTATGTVKLKSEFANENGELWPGEFVNVRLQVKTVTGGIVVPSTAVQRGPDGSYVYKVQPDATVAVQPVQVAGEADEGNVMISSGLAEGDKVVTEGQFRLKAGSKVQALAPGEAPPAPVAAQKGDGTKAPDAKVGGRKRGG